MRAQAEMAAVVRASVLLLGLPGSGRRHLAEVIHYSGPADSIGPLVPLECSLLDAESIQATLRGGRRSAKRAARCCCATPISFLPRARPRWPRSWVRAVALCG